jgi:hypothetical protein
MLKCLFPAGLAMDDRIQSFEPIRESVADFSLYTGLPIV